MTDEKDPQPTSAEGSALQSRAAVHRRDRSGDDTTRANAALDVHSSPDRLLSGLERIREILLGDILVEIERRLGLLNHQVAARTSDLHQDVRRRTDVLDAHVRREIEAVTTQISRATREVNDAIRNLGLEQQRVRAEADVRLARIEDRVEAAIVRIERETRQQLLDQANWFVSELGRARQQIHSSLASELGVESAPVEEGNEHEGGELSASH